MKRFTGDLAMDAIIAREIRFGQTRWAEVWCSFIMLGVGLVLLAPIETFSSPGYRVVSQFVTEVQAGSLATVVGLARLTALYINGRRGRPTSSVRMVGCMMGFAFWTAMTIGFALAIPPLPLAIGVYPVLAFAELHSSRRAAGDMAAENVFGLRKRMVQGAADDVRSGRTT